METHIHSVAAHYGQDDLFASIVDALKLAGKDPDALTIENLPAVDEVHTRGRDATMEVAVHADLTLDLFVVDVGSGIRGPARYIARTFGFA
ncbi:MAG: hypothetical protein GKS00_09450 [Alphaproteobacteria bacterium]|nr:hypothetical protein [Alphaproteobacteria bacterium]